MRERESRRNSGGAGGKYEGREHTIRASWENKHNARTVRCINGIDGVAGMQYIKIQRMGGKRGSSARGSQNIRRRLNSNIIKEG